jgi:carbon monoxide dehydrogenase subunit G
LPALEVFLGFVKVEESLLVGAPPEKVYKVLADPNHHAKILPEEFTSYGPESDSIVAFTLKVGGVERRMRVRTEETEPNRLFREVEISSNIATEFLLEPHEDGTVVTISMKYETKKSIAGWIETMTVPLLLRPLYKKELVKLGRYVLLVSD